MPAPDRDDGWELTNLILASNYLRAGGEIPREVQEWLLRLCEHRQSELLTARTPEKVEEWRPSS